MAQPTKIDWNAAKQDYLADATVSYSDIAKKYGVSLKVVKDWGAKQQWPEARRVLAEKAQKLWEEKLPEAQAEARTRHLLHAKNLQALGQQLVRSMADSQAALNPSELRALAQALKIALDLERVSLAMPTSVTGIGNAKGDDLPALTGLAAVAEQAQKILNAKDKSDT